MNEVCYKCGLQGKMDVFPCHFYNIGVSCNATLCYGCRAVQFVTPLSQTVVYGVCPDCELALHEKASRTIGMDFLDLGPRKEADIVFLWATGLYKKKHYGRNVGLEETYERLYSKIKEIRK